MEDRMADDLVAQDGSPTTGNGPMQLQSGGKVRDAIK